MIVSQDIFPWEFMKICTVCNRTYSDESLNFCLDDGGALTKYGDNAPPTIMMDAPRTTDQSNWQNMGTGSPWSDQANQQQNMQQAQAAFPSATKSNDQTLPIISLVLGVLSLLLFCCYAGIPLGAGAVIVGYLGMSNANKDPMRYTGRGMAIGGMVLGAIGFLISIGLLLLGVIVNAF